MKEKTLEELFEEMDKLLMEEANYWAGKPESDLRNQMLELNRTQQLGALKAHQALKNLKKDADAAIFCLQMRKVLNQMMED